MRGHPLLQLILVACLFTAAGFPVWRVTHSAAAAAPASLPAAGSPAAETPLDVHVTFAPAPADFRLSYLGKVVLEGRGPQVEFQGTWRVALPPEGADLALESHFPTAATAGPAAVRVQCRFPDGHTTERTVWADADQPLVELVTVTP